MMGSDVPRVPRVSGADEAFAGDRLMGRGARPPRRVPGRPVAAFA
jgi:hypothetical protein